uniref:hypothetical protein n=1 Tax=Oceanicella sp. SM1341 TaxID=1548889 RepID=UPI0018E5967E
PGDPDIDLALGDLDVEVGLDPVEELVGDIDVVADLGDPLSLLPEGEPGDPDIDLALGDLEVEVGLDPVEELVGDIDVVADLGDPLSLLPEGEPGDPDIDLALGDLDVEVGLDPVEELVGDIDLVADLSGDGLEAVIEADTIFALLDGSGDGGVSGADESLLTGLDGSQLADSEPLLTGAVTDTTSTLSEPVGNIASGLGSLVQPSTTLSKFSFGGLF